MKVSVVIPAFNEEKYIKRCLLSIINQEIAKSLGVTVIFEKVQGMIFARNSGFNYAVNEIVARCDADVIVTPDWIKKIKLNFSKNKIDALSGPISYIDSPLILKTSMPSQIYLKSLKLFTKGKVFLIGPNMIITKNIWEKVKLNVSLDDSSVHEDIDLSLNIIKAGGIIGYDRSLVVESSARRIVSNPQSFFGEYSARLLKTFWLNRN